MEPLRIVIEIHITEEGAPHVYYLAGDPAIKHPEGKMILSVVLDCERWPKKIGKKLANSCKGCTVTCPAKGKYQGEPLEIKS